MNIFKRLSIWVLTLLVVLVPSAPAFALVSEGAVTVIDPAPLIIVEPEPASEPVVVEPVVAEELPVVEEPIVRDTNPNPADLPVVEEILDEKVLQEVSEEVLDTKPVQEVAPTKEVEEEKVIEPRAYTILMRDVAKEFAGKHTNEVLAKELQAYIEKEEIALDGLGVKGKNKRAFLKQLEKQRKVLAGEQPTFFEKVKESVKDVVSSDKPKENIMTPKKPSTFHFNDEDVAVNSFEVFSEVQPQHQPFWHSLQDVFLTQEVIAYDDIYMPVFADTQADGDEVIINSEIRSLAKHFNNNPLEIYNFLRNNIEFEPYSGSRKGSVGCLADMRCNDVDSASLTIALMRAAGIPARYKKSIGVFKVEQLQELLGVEETKTVYANLHLNKIPVHVLNGDEIADPIVGEQLDDADLSQIEKLAIEWVHSEIFVTYDHRGGDIDNAINFVGAETTSDVRDILRTDESRQWIPTDVLIKPHVHTANEVVFDTANFDTEAFWFDFYEYQGSLSPFEKARQDLVNQTGKDFTAAQYQSGNAVVQGDLSILPFTVPYLRGEGVDAEGNRFDIEDWSVLPGDRRLQVRVSLLDADSENTVFEQTMFATDLDNAPMDLLYRGATQADQDAIDERGGIHATPAALVDIVPTFTVGGQDYVGEELLQVGQGLILQFETIHQGEVWYTDQKFSVAGNNEGIFMTFSGVREDPVWDDEEDEHRKAKVLLEGNAMVAREYLKRVGQSSDALAAGMDYEYNLQFGRAVVTQNRVLNEIDGTPTTFDFKGLTLDATAYITDQSRSGNYKNHQKDFRLLWGQQASYDEAQIFADMAGLESISTVTGLQYANANPGQYTVHVIREANEGDIDGLDLSDNTKALMHEAVQEGSTVVTPNKLVERGQFRGVLYVVLKDTWSGRYAIGEQVGNGGISYAGWEAVPFFDGVFNSTMYTNFLEAAENLQISYVDGQSKYGVLCSVTEARHNELVARDDWSPFYGFPCFEETRQFGSKQHTYIFASHATKFFQGNAYNYWVTEADARNVMAPLVSSFKSDDFKFNAFAATYSYNKKGHGVYYEPTANGGDAHSVQGTVFRKLMFPNYNPEYSWCSGDELSNQECKDFAKKRTWVLNTIGFPTGNQADAATSDPYDTDGYYQQFIGGDIYTETEWLNETYYVPGMIAEEFNDGQYCGAAGCGTGGDFGFPIDDPKYSAPQEMVLQDFENGSRIKDFQSRAINAHNRVEVAYSIQTIPLLRNTYDGEFGDNFNEGFMDALSTHNIYGLGVTFVGGMAFHQLLNNSKKQIVEKLGKKAAGKFFLRAVPVLGWVITGVTATIAYDQNAPLYEACNTDPDIDPDIKGAPPAYYCGVLAGNSLAFAVGYTSDVMGGKLINKWSTNTNIARAQKVKMQEILDPKSDTALWNNYTSSIKSSKVRTEFLTSISHFDESDLRKLMDDKPFMLRLGQKDQSAFRGFVGNSNSLGTYEHVFYGNNGGGWHYYPAGITKNTNQVVSFGRVNNQTGVYEARVIVGNGEEKWSTFFPDDWSPEEVMDAINAGFVTKSVNQSGHYVATVNGIDIRYNIDEATGKIISAFPNHETSF